MDGLVDYLYKVKENFDDIKENGLLMDAFQEVKDLKKLKDKVDYNLTQGIIGQAYQAKGEIKQEAKDAKSKSVLFWVFLAIIILVIIMILVAIYRFFTKKVMPELPSNLQFQQPTQPTITTPQTSPYLQSSYDSSSTPMFSSPDYNQKPQLKGGKFKKNFRKY